MRKHGVIVNGPGSTLDGLRIVAWCGKLPRRSTALSWPNCTDFTRYCSCMHSCVHGETVTWTVLRAPAPLQWTMILAAARRVGTVMGRSLKPKTDWEKTLGSPPSPHQRHQQTATDQQLTNRRRETPKTPFAKKGVHAPSRCSTFGLCYMHTLRSIPFTHARRASANVSLLPLRALNAWWFTVRNLAISKL